MVNIAPATPPSLGGGEVLACRLREGRALVIAVREVSPEVVIDQAEDLRRRLLEQVVMLRYEADLAGLLEAEVAAAMALTRAAQLLHTVSTALPIEVARQTWVVAQVVGFATQLIMIAASGHLTGPDAATDRWTPSPL